MNGFADNSAGRIRCLPVTWDLRIKTERTNLVNSNALGVY